MFEHIDPYPGDPILSLMEAFTQDIRPTKVNLAVGLYYDEQGRIPKLEAVQLAEAKLQQTSTSYPYLPIEGAANYRQALAPLVFGENADFSRIATIQTVGGSSALKIAADFLKYYFPSARVWLSDPSWENHSAVFEGSGFKVERYPYYDAQNHNVRFADMLHTLETLPARDIVLLHPCCHNPTGVDLSLEQGDQVNRVLAQRQLIPLLDMAYQGLGQGLVEDAYAIRALLKQGVSFLVANSFSKIFSLYGERCGGLSVVCADPEEAARVLSQLKATVRRNYSSPPTHGSQLIANVLLDPGLRASWEDELSQMRKRIQTMRQALYTDLVQALPGRDFSYLLTQRGMFSYTGLSAEQVERLQKDHAIYAVRTGRICIAGLNHSNVKRVAQAFCSVL